MGKSKLNIADMRLIPFDRITYLYPFIWSQDGNDISVIVVVYPDTSLCKQVTMGVIQHPVF